MPTLDVQGIDPTLDAPSVNPPTVKKDGISLRRAATTLAAALALIGADVADAGIVRLPVWVDFVVVKGNIGWPTRAGGVWDYIFSDDQWNILFSGTGILGAPIAGDTYKVTFEAEREGTGEVLNMLMEFPNLRFTGAYSFEAWNFNVANGFNTLSNSNYVVGGWDNTGSGDIWMIGKAHISAVPEPSSGALAVLGLSALGLAALRRKSAPGATPGEEKPETPAV